MFPSLTLWNPEEGGKNHPKSWFEMKGGMKERNKNPINYNLFGYVLIFLFLQNPWAAFHYFQLRINKYLMRNYINIFLPKIFIDIINLIINWFRMRCIHIIFSIYNICTMYIVYTYIYIYIALLLLNKILIPYWLVSKIFRNLKAKWLKKIF